MSALILPFPRPGRPLDFSYALERIEQAIEWLENNGVVVRGFGHNRGGPLVAVEASARVERLLSKLVDSRRRNQTHRVFEAETPSGVRIVWEVALS